MSAIEELAQGLRRRLIDDARDGRSASCDPTRGALRQRIAELLREQARPLDEPEREALVERLLASTMGLGPLEPLMEDREVDEIMVNGARSVLVERGRPHRAHRRVVRVRGGAAARDRADPQPARAAGGRGRAAGGRPPARRLARQLRDPAAEPRRPAAHDPAVSQARASRRTSWSRTARSAPSALDFLRESVESRRNVVVSGGTGSGKTTLLNVLSSLHRPRASA